MQTQATLAVFIKYLMLKQKSHCSLLLAQHGNRILDTRRQWLNIQEQAGGRYAKVSNQLLALTLQQPCLVTEETLSHHPVGSH